MTPTHPLGRGTWFVVREPDKRQASTLLQAT